MFVYFDASVLAKRYVLENGTDLVNELFASLPRQNMMCATIGLLEVVSVISRAYNRRMIPVRDFNQALANLRHELILDDFFALIALDDKAVLAAAEFIPKHNINATDAIILRSCLDLRATKLPQLVLWSCDKRLTRAATQEGVPVFDPEIQTADVLHRWLESLGDDDVAKVD